MLLLFTSAAKAADGFRVDRFDMSDRVNDWFVNDSLDLRGNLRLGLTAVGDWGKDPLVLYDRSSGDKIGAVVSSQWVMHLGMTVTLFHTLRLSAALPFVAHQSSDRPVVDGAAVFPESASAVGDLRFAAVARLLGSYRAPFSAAVGARIFVPSGQSASFAGDATTRVVPEILAGGDVSMLVYSMRLGLNLRKSKTAWDVELGQEFLVSAGLGVRAASNVLVGAEIWGATTLEGSPFSEQGSPLELLFQGHVNLGDLSVGAGVGPGLTRGYGTPTVRALLGLDWTPEPPVAPPSPPRDSDRDGVPDVSDACPNEPGVKSPELRVNGCPPVAAPVLDADGDGILDGEDACPSQPGVRSDDPSRNGCPKPPDADEDGIEDASDACPTEAGPKTSDPRTNGCPPPPDSDKDGILDRDDACPKDAGVRSTNPEANGCPLARIDSTQIKIIEPVQFAHNSDRILPASEPVLSAVLDAIRDASVSRLEVHGYTDDRGGAAYNQQLSRKRAASVARWLSEHGVPAAHIVSKGFGKENPIAPNTTDEGRQKNRRVEFHIMATE
ncbi:MAG: OmpA family protein [Polyangiaceae bacterium]